MLPLDCQKPSVLECCIAQRCEQSVAETCCPHVYGSRKFALVVPTLWTLTEALSKCSADFGCFGVHCRLQQVHEESLNGGTALRASAEACFVGKGTALEFDDGFFAVTSPSDAVARCSQSWTCTSCISELACWHCPSLMRGGCLPARLWSSGACDMPPARTRDDCQSEQARLQTIPRDQSVLEFQGPVYLMRYLTKSLDVWDVGLRMDIFLRALSVHGFIVGNLDLACLYVRLLVGRLTPAHIQTRLLRWPALIRSAAKFGVNTSDARSLVISPGVPESAPPYLNDGAHRLALALYFGLPAPLRATIAPGTGEGWYMPWKLMLEHKYLTTEEAEVVGRLWDNLVSCIELAERGFVRGDECTVRALTRTGILSALPKWSTPIEGKPIKYASCDAQVGEHMEKHR